MASSRYGVNAYGVGLYSAGEELTISASFAGVGTLAIPAVRQAIPTASFNGAGSVAFPAILISSTHYIGAGYLGEASLVVVAGGKRTRALALTASATLFAPAQLVWAAVSPDTDVWADVTPDDDTWTAVTPDDDTWTDVA